MWQLLSSGTLDEFEAGAPATWLEHGTKMRLEMKTSIPIAPLFDMLGMEWVTSKMINEGGAHITDVEGVGWNKVVVHMEANAVWVPIIIGVIVAICIYFGWQLFTELKLFAEAIGPVAWGIIACIAAAIAIPVIMSLVRKPKKKEEA